MSSSNQPDRVFVIIVTYNGEPWIRSCLNSVSASEYPADVVVVDNRSADNTTALIEADFPYVHLIKNDFNAGFGAANNTGISAARKLGAQFFFLLNQDTVVAADVIGKLVHAFRQNVSFHILSPVHLNTSGSDLDGGFRSYVARTEKTNLANTVLTERTLTCMDVDFVNAAAWMLPLSTVEKTGGFAPLFFHYGEDRDYVNRLHFFNMQIGLVTSAFIRHCRDERNMDISRWSYEKKIRYYYVGWLTRAANINRAFVPAWLEGFIWVASETVAGLLRLRLQYFAVAAVVAGKIVKSHPEIIAHRKAVRSQAPFKFIP